MANNFATKLHIDNRRRHTLCQKARELWSQSEGLVSVEMWRHGVKFETPLTSLKQSEIESWNFANT